jgi:hypothetical protein
MIKMLNLTRRAAIVGALMSSAVAVAPAVQAISSPEISAELRDLLDRYFDTRRAQSAADAAATAAYKAFTAELKASPIRVRMSATLTEYMSLDGTMTAESILAEIDRVFAQRLAAAERVRAEQPRITKMLVSPEQLRAEQAALRAQAEEQIAAFRAAEEAHGLKRLDDAAADVWETRHAAQKALFAYTPQSAVEIEVIAARFLDDVDEHGRFWSLPTEALLRMFAGREPDADA